MIASSDEARLLFNKWEQASPPLKIRLISSSLIFDALGLVTGFTPQTLTLGGDAWQVVIPLSDATFSFSDPREVPIDSVRASEAARYELGLSLRLPNGEEITLLELKTPDEDDTQGGDHKVEDSNQ